MRIIAKSKIVDYYTENPEAEIALEDWYHKTKLTEWNNFADMKKTFNSVDNVGNQHYVFNIKGNNYRLIVVIKFTIKTILIRFIGTTLHLGKNPVSDYCNRYYLAHLVL